MTDPTPDQILDTEPYFIRLGKDLVPLVTELPEIQIQLLILEELRSLNKTSRAMLSQLIDVETAVQNS